MSISFHAKWDRFFIPFHTERDGFWIAEILRCGWIEAVLGLWDVLAYSCKFCLILTIYYTFFALKSDSICTITGRNLHYFGSFVQFPKPPEQAYLAKWDAKNSLWDGDLHEFFCFLSLKSGNVSEFLFKSYLYQILSWKNERNHAKNQLLKILYR
jgi:hypothetical protein